VVDARYQLRAGVLVGAVAIVLLVLLDASLILQDRATAATAATAVRPILLAGQDRASWALLLSGSAVFLGGVILVGVLESHRTAGAAYAIRRAVDAIHDGQSEVRVRLRRGDHLQDLARSVNQLAETIDAERLRRH
jgi:signal transduction histidine kinase